MHIHAHTVYTALSRTAGYGSGVPRVADSLLRGWYDAGL